jgi:hypothetical protein
MSAAEPRQTGFNPNRQKFFWYRYSSRTLPENRPRLSIRQIDRFEQEINEIVQKYSEADWDGYGAFPICIGSVQYARQFLKLIASQGFKNPDLVPEPTGDLGMLWSNETCDLAISIDEKGVLSWATFMPSGGDHDSEIFKGRISSKIENLFWQMDGA